MKINELMRERMTVSYEVFPPKTGMPTEPLMETLDKIKTLDPDFISCTYGAGGTNRGRQSEILRYIGELGIDAMANYTCIGSTREYTRALVEEYLGIGVDVFLALRGDIPKGQTGTEGDFDHGNELIAFLRKSFPELCIAAACYPEKHLTAPDMDFEMDVLMMKQEAGADFFVSQLCHDLDNFLRYRDMAAARGVTLPIDFGLMPVLAKNATLSMALSNGCSVPKELATIIGRWGDEPEEFKRAGKEYTVRQAERLISEGVAGLHIFALNKYDDVADIVRAVGLI